MRLKSLEIKGFKSFADKTIINFDEGITGVIGPNGCGKSNIIDSIRWVIGEHKISNLRSENLESLVFNNKVVLEVKGEKKTEKVLLGLKSNPADKII